jgi:hypothetical protein
LGTFSGDQRVLDLFAGKQMRLALTTALRGPSAGADLSGRVHVTRLDATVVAGRKGAHSGP